ncbi:MAG: ribosome biogenesis factor YjgA [Desulfuromonadales bacterium]|nr:ribosome biogenesis factor YjgA [Desulfuromonadales bacterium]
MHSDDQDTPQWDGPSKSALKRDAKAVEDLVWQLLELGDADLPKLEVGEEVRAELLLLRAIDARGGQRRQIRHLAGVLRKREDDVQWLRDFLAGNAAEQYAANARQHELEAWRERLVTAHDAAATYAEICQRWPLLDRKRLRNLQKSVLANGDKKAYREIFRLLRSAADDAAG